MGEKENWNSLSTVKRGGTGDSGVRRNSLKDVNSLCLYWRLW